MTQTKLQIKLNQSDWANPTILVLAICGALLTSYLTHTHFASGSPAFCTASGSGCELVFSSAYAKVFDLPLTLFEALTYLAIATLVKSSKSAIYKPCLIPYPNT
jgi:uncharacterized membrane protein